MKKLFILLLLMTGCVSVQDNYRLSANEAIHGFNQLPRVTGEYVLLVPAMKIHIVPNHTYFPPGNNRFGVWGCAGGNEIWVHGAIVDGKIILEPASLGHGFWHIIENNNPGVWDPDIWMEGK